MYELRHATNKELAPLSDLAMRSKAVWGYDAEFMSACRAELTLTESHLKAALLRVAADGDELLGFLSASGSPPRGWVNMLFVEPQHLREGIGEALLTDARHRLHKQGFRTLLLDADPGAEPFYLKQGATRVGMEPSGSILGRFLPRLKLVL